MPFLILALMAVIFAFSAQEEGASAKTSLAVTGKVLVMTGQTDDASLSDLSATARKTADLIVRKCGHLAEYTLLGLLIMSHVSDFRKRAWLWTVPAGFIYAASDEFHQYFVPGRSALFTDVLIDTSGVIIGILLLLLIKRIILKIKH